MLADAPEEILTLWRLKAWTDFAQMTGTFFLTLVFSIEVSTPCGLPVTSAYARRPVSWRASSSP